MVPHLSISATFLGVAVKSFTALMFAVLVTLTGVSAASASSDQYVETVAATEVVEVQNSTANGSVAQSAGATFGSGVTFGSGALVWLLTGAAGLTAGGTSVLISRKRYALQVEPA